MEATGFGVMHVDENDRIIAFVEKPADPPGIPGKPGHRAGLDGHLRLPDASSCSTSCAATPPTPDSQPRLRQGHHPLHRQARQGRRPPLRRVLRALGRGGRGLLARRRHGRRLLGGQYRPDRHRPGARPLRPATGRSGPTPRSRRRPSSSTTRTAAAARRSRSLVSGDCIVSGALAAAARCCSPACACNSYSQLDDAVILPVRRHRPPRAAAATSSSTAACASPTAWSSARIRSSTRSASAAPTSGICLITQPMIDRLGA